MRNRTKELWGGSISRSWVAQRGPPASVLVISPDATIASLVGELVAFAGHRPEHDFTDGAGGDGIRRARPDLAVIDAALDCRVVDVCVDACDEVRARPVLTTSTGSEADLLYESHKRGCIPFPLPGRPRQLNTIIDGILSLQRRPLVAIDATNGALMRPALNAAIAGLARARQLMQRVRPANDAPRCVQMHEQLAAVRSSRDALRAAVRDYARVLAERNASEQEMLATIARELEESASTVGAASAIEPIDGEWKSWAREAYRAA